VPLRALRLGGSPPGRRRDGEWLIGTGVAASTYPARRRPSRARARREADGCFTVALAAADIGTGARTVLSQIAADALEVELDQVGDYLNRDLAGYHVPSCADITGLEVDWIEEDDPHSTRWGPRGSARSESGPARAQPREPLGSPGRSGEGCVWSAALTARE
jgi:CO/xanthine dehydrogenase Mo-binding subunit